MMSVLPGLAVGWFRSSEESRGRLRRFLVGGAALVFLFASAASCVYAQAATEYGSATSGTAGSMSRINLMNKAAFPTAKNGRPTVIESKLPKKKKGDKSSRFILESESRGSTEANRKTFEAHAGKDAAKLMLRSEPSNAYVRLNGLPVGRTPLLLIVAPGQYKVVLDGQRLEHEEKQVDLLPRETREYSLKLKPQYPSQVQLNLH